MNVSEDNIMVPITTDDYVMLESEENIVSTEMKSPKEVIEENTNDIIEIEKEKLKNLVQSLKDTTCIRKVRVPAHRFTPLKKNWLELIEPIVKHLKLLVRMNTKSRHIELKAKKSTPAEAINLHKASEYLKAFMLGFEIKDAIALLRLNDLYLESFQIADVKTLRGDNLSRCIGRISGRHGQTKNAIENATRTRIVLADSHLHVLGAHQNIRAARNSICSLILGSPANKVYNKLRIISRRLLERN